MNYHTLSDFRSQHPEWLKEQVVTNIAAIQAEGLASLEVLGQDGMRVGACAGNVSFNLRSQAAATAGRRRAEMGPSATRV